MVSAGKGNNMKLKKDNKFILNLLKSLVNIESVSNGEHDIMLYLEKEIKSWGVKTKRYSMGDKRFNLLGRYGKGKPVLCLNSHADTVPASGTSWPRAKVKKGVLYGLGACDVGGYEMASVTACCRAASNCSGFGIMNGWSN